MKKIAGLTFLNIDECLTYVNQKLEKKLTAEDIITNIEEGKIISNQIDGITYVSQCDLKFFTTSINQPDIFKDAHYLGGIGIDFSQLTLNGNVLDIGGGGEGIIGQVSNDVVAIDPLKSELEEAPSGPLKIVMNAKDLQFLDETFETVTSFFTLMFISNHDHEQIFNEIYRVLKPNGEFILWDVDIPQNDKQIYITFLEVQLKEKTINTGYGQRYKDKIQHIDYFIQLGKKVGFSVSETENIGNNAYMVKFTKK